MADAESEPTVLVAKLDGVRERVVEDALEDSPIQATVEIVRFLLENFDLELEIAFLDLFFVGLHILA